MPTSEQTLQTCSKNARELQPRSNLGAIVTHWLAKIDHIWQRSGEHWSMLTESEQSVPKVGPALANTGKSPPRLGKALLWSCFALQYVAIPPRIPWPMTCSTSCPSLIVPDGVDLRSGAWECQTVATRSSTLRHSRSLFLPFFKIVADLAQGISNSLTVEKRGHSEVRALCKSLAKHLRRYAPRVAPASFGGA